MSRTHSRYQSLDAGQFGLADETGRLLNQAITQGVAQGLGIGQSIARHLSDTRPPFAGASIAAACHRLEIPLTVHIAVGTDIIHMHPDASGAALGEGSLRDFRYFVSNVSRLERGVYLPPSQFEAFFVSLAHERADLDRVIAAHREALSEIG